MKKNFAKTNVDNNISYPMSKIPQVISLLQDDDNDNTSEESMVRTYMNNNSIS